MLYVLHVRQVMSQPSVTSHVTGCTATSSGHMETELNFIYVAQHNGAHGCLLGHLPLYRYICNAGNHAK